MTSRCELAKVSVRLVLLWLVPTVAVASDIPLKRDPQDYLILGMRTVRVFSLAMEPPGCNLGVNCAPTAQRRGGCGFLHAKSASLAGGQAVANMVCGSDSFFQVFSNSPGACAGPNCASIAHPGPSSDCTEPFSTPLIADLDGDQIPSCDANCVVDTGDIAAACGVALPLPACDLGRPVLADEGGDCSVGDVLPGNGRCDLGAGTYGAVRVRKGGHVVFDPGTTVICSLNVRTAARVTSAGPATILVPGGGSVKFNNSVDLAADCGMLRIVSERGLIKFGRFGDYTVDACTISGRLQLGHGNNLRGHLVGDLIASDISNDGRCCPAPVVTTTTSTSTTTSSSTTTSTIPGGTTTTTSTSTTTSTIPGGTTTTTSTSTSTTSTSTTTSTIPGGTTTTSSPSTSLATTTTSSSTTTTTVPDGFTRTPGFYKNHPAITQQILSAAHGLSVCGHTITDVDVDHAHSALEGLCIAVQGDQRAQLARHLITAALTRAAGGATFADLAACDAVCRNASASAADLAACIDETDAFNNSGDSIPAPFDPPGAASPGPCMAAFETACTVLTPSTCGTP